MDGSGFVPVVQRSLSLHIMSLPQVFLDGCNEADLMAMLQGDVNTLNNVLGACFDFYGATLQLFGLVVVLIVLNPFLAALVICFIPAFIGFQLRQGRAVNDASHAVKLAEKEYLRVIQENMVAASTRKLLGLTDVLNEKIRAEERHVIAQYDLLDVKTARGIRSFLFATLVLKIGLIVLGVFLHATENPWPKVGDECSWAWFTCSAAQCMYGAGAIATPLTVTSSATMITLARLFAFVSGAEPVQELCLKIVESLRTFQVGKSSMSLLRHYMRIPPDPWPAHALRMKKELQAGLLVDAAKSQATEVVEAAQARLEVARLEKLLANLTRQGNVPAMQRAVADLDLARGRLKKEQMEAEVAAAKAAAIGAKMSALQKQISHADDTTLTFGVSIREMEETVELKPTDTFVLKVSLLHGTDLGSGVNLGSDIPDPWVQIRVGDQTRRSTHRANSFNPTWEDEQWMFSFSSQPIECEVECFDHNMFSSSVSLGKATMDLHSVCSDAEAVEAAVSDLGLKWQLVEVDLPLRAEDGADGKPSGCLTFQVHWARRDPAAPHPKGGLAHFEHSAYAMKVEDVSFGFLDETGQITHFVVKEVDFEVPIGAKVGVLGRSGSGKTTLLNLITRLYQPLNGRIKLLGGESLNDTVLSDVMVVMEQEHTLFDGTILENVLLGLEDATEDDAIEACQLAGLYEEIMGLPAGMHTRVGYRGKLLSGGQRQRCCLARLMARRKPILILDEPASTLDPEAVKQLANTLGELTCPDPRHEGATLPVTVISSTHQLAVAENFTHMLCLHDGKVAEFGLKDELFARKGHYYRYITRQSGIFLDKKGRAVITPDRLRMIWLFAQAPFLALMELAKVFETRSYVIGEEVYRAGSELDSLFILVSGTVETRAGITSSSADKVEPTTPDAKTAKPETTRATPAHGQPEVDDESMGAPTASKPAREVWQPGDEVNLLSLVDDHLVATGTAVATSERTTLLVLSRSALERQLEADKSLSESVGETIRVMQQMRSPRGLQLICPFMGMSFGALEKVSAALDIETYDEEVVVCDDARQPCDSLYMLVFGGLTIRHNAQRRRSSGDDGVEKLRRGAIFGELAMLPESPSESLEESLHARNLVTKVKATEFSVMLKLTRKKLEQLMASEPEIATTCKRNVRRWLHTIEPDTLVKNWLFSCCPRMCLQDLVPAWQISAHGEGYVPLEEAVSDDVCIVLLSGSAVVERRRNDDRSRVLKPVQAGDIVNVVTLLGNPSHFGEDIVRVELTSPSLLLTLERDRFQDVACTTINSKGIADLLPKLQLIGKTRANLMCTKGVTSLRGVPRGISEEAIRALIDQVTTLVVPASTLFFDVAAEDFPAFDEQLDVDGFEDDDIQAEAVGPSLMQDMSPRTEDFASSPEGRLAMQRLRSGRFRIRRQPDSSTLLEAMPTLGRRANGVRPAAVAPAPPPRVDLSQRAPMIHVILSGALTGSLHGSGKEVALKGGDVFVTYSQSEAAVREGVKIVDCAETAPARLGSNGRSLIMRVDLTSISEEALELRRQQEAKMLEEQRIRDAGKVKLKGLQKKVRTLEVRLGYRVPLTPIQLWRRGFLRVRALRASGILVHGGIRTGNSSIEDEIADAHKQLLSLHADERTRTQQLAVIWQRFDALQPVLFDEEPTLSSEDHAKDTYDLTLARIDAAQERLRELEHFRRKCKDPLLSEVMSLWNRNGVSDEHRVATLSTATELDHSSFKRLREEIESQRLSLVKPMRVAQARLTAIWRKMQIPKERTLEFVWTEGESVSEERLKLAEEEADRLEWWSKHVAETLAKFSTPTATRIPMITNGSSATPPANASKVESEHLASLESELERVRSEQAQSQAEALELRAQLAKVRLEGRALKSQAAQASAPPSDELSSEIATEQGAIERQRLQGSLDAQSSLSHKLEEIVVKLSQLLEEVERAWKQRAAAVSQSEIEALDAAEEKRREERIAAMASIRQAQAELAANEKERLAQSAVATQLLRARFSGAMRKRGESMNLHGAQKVLQAKRAGNRRVDALDQMNTVSLREQRQKELAVRLEAARKSVGSEQRNGTKSSAASYEALVVRRRELMDEARRALAMLGVNETGTKKFLEERAPPEPIAGEVGPSKVHQLRLGVQELDREVQRLQTRCESDGLILRLRQYAKSSRLHISELPRSISGEDAERKGFTLQQLTQWLEKSGIVYEKDALSYLLHEMDMTLDDASNLNAPLILPSRFVKAIEKAAVFAVL